MLPLSITTGTAVGTYEQKITQIPFTLTLIRSVSNFTANSTTFADTITLQEKTPTEVITYQVKYTFTFPSTNIEYTGITTFPGSTNTQADAILKVTFLDVNGSNIDYQLKVDNSDIFNSIENNLAKTTLTVTFGISALDSSVDCGPKVSALVVGDQLKVNVEDIGYMYSVVDSHLSVKATENCDITTSEFFIPLQCINNIERYILSGFVYGKFQCIVSNSEFDKRLMLTPFRRFF